MPVEARDVALKLKDILKTQTFDKVYDPEQIEKLSAKYLQSMGFNLKGELSITNSLVNFEKNRITNAQEFTETKLAKGTLGDLLEQAEKDPTKAQLKNKPWQKNSMKRLKDHLNSSKLQPNLAT